MSDFCKRRFNGISIQIYGTFVCDYQGFVNIECCRHVDLLYSGKKCFLKSGLINDRDFILEDLKHGEVVGPECDFSV